MFLCHGPTFSDRIMLDQQTLIDEIQSVKKFKVGSRVEYEAGTFDVTDPVNILENHVDTILVVGEIQAKQDSLEGVPII